MPACNYLICIMFVIFSDASSGKCCELKCYVRIPVNVDRDGGVGFPKGADASVGGVAQVL